MTLAENNEQWRVVLTRALRTTLALCAMTCLPLQGADEASSPGPLTSVADLRYGVVLYEYYQDNYMEALSELMVAKARGGIKGHRENPDIIEGGISLAFGMEQKAGELFTRLLDDSQPLDVRNSAWYYLAKLRYLQGNLAGSADSLARIEGQLDKRLLAESDNLQVNLSIRTGQLNLADEVLNKLPPADPMHAYHLFNLGNAHARAQDFERAQNYYQALERYTIDEFAVADDPYTAPAQQRAEILTLYDKTLTASGFSLMMNKEYESAMATFSRVRQGSDFSEQALLGYGWAAYQQKDYQLALKPWQQLSAGDMSGAPVQEALLGVPTIYEKMENNGLALQSYDIAEQRFEQEMSRLRQLAEELNNSQLRDLLKIKADQTGWLALDQQLNVIPNQLELTQLFSQNRFQGAVQELQELLALQQKMQQWREKLDIYQWTWDERQAARASTTEMIERQPWRDQIVELTQTREALSARLDDIVENKKYLDLAQGQTLDTQAAVERMERNIRTLKAAGKPVGEYVEAARLYRGIAFWQASESFSDGLWKNQVLLRQVDESLATLISDQDRFDLALQGFQNGEAAGLSASFSGRLEQLKARVDAKSSAIDVALTSAEKQLSEQIALHLGERGSRLRHYLSQVRLAKARLFDAALSEQQ